MSIDFHTHVLPGIDDGSHSVRQSLHMLEMQQAAGITHIVATPHFYARKDSVEAFVKRRTDSVRRLKEAMEGTDLAGITLRCGAEVYYFEGIGKTSMIEQLCMEDSRLILLEMPFCQWEKAMLSDVKALLEQGITVVLAHIERYLSYQKDKSVWEAIFSLPVYAQVNGGSFLHWNRRRPCLGFIRDGYAVILGSDCHNTESRQPNLGEARHVIEKKLGASVLTEIDTRMEELLR